MTTDSRHKTTLGEDISYGLQQTLACWATDFIDPYVCKYVQDKFKDHQHSSTMEHTWGGEIIGDTAAFFAFLGVQRFMPEPVQWLKETVKSVGDPFYDKLGRKSLIAWAREHHVTDDSERFKQKLEDWKDFQADNFAKSSVISVSSTLLNVATQKAMGNTHTLPVIAISKVIGATITMGTMVGLRFVLPKTTRELDEELSDRYFSPMIRGTQRLLGAEVTPMEELTHHPHEEHETPSRRVKPQSVSLSRTEGIGAAPGA